MINKMIQICTGTLNYLVENLLKNSHGDVQSAQTYTVQRYFKEYVIHHVKNSFSQA